MDGEDASENKGEKAVGLLMTAYTEEQSQSGLKRENCLGQTGSLSVRPQARSVSSVVGCESICCQVLAWCLPCEETEGE